MIQASAKPYIHSSPALRRDLPRRACCRPGSLSKANTTLTGTVHRTAVGAANTTLTETAHRTPVGVGERLARQDSATAAEAFRRPTPRWPCLERQAGRAGGGAPARTVTGGVTRRDPPLGADTHPRTWNFLFQENGPEAPYPTPSKGAKAILLDKQY